MYNSSCLIPSYLYTVVISLYPTLDDAFTGLNVIDSESHRLGLRDIDVGGRHNQLRLNRKPLTIAGAPVPPFTQLYKIATTEPLQMHLRCEQA